MKTWQIIALIGVAIFLLGYFIGANNPPKSVIQKAVDKLKNNG